jgi:hypothetical protein
VTTLFVKAGALRRDDWGLLGRAVFTVARVRLVLWILPWRQLKPAQRVMPPLTPVHPRRLEWAIRVASRVVPGATCLTQALALHHLLARFGYASIVQVGVRRQQGNFSAHAWVEHDDQSFLGSSNDIARYARFFTWPHSRLG